MMDKSADAVPLEFLLVSSDHKTLKIVQTAINQLRANLGCTTTTDAARNYLGSHKVDGVILDIADDSALDLIAAIRHGTNHRAFIFACVGEKASTTEGLKIGANVVLRKPLSQEAILSNIRTFKGIILAERRRFFRHTVTLPISLVVDNNESGGMVEDISEAGMAIRLSRSLAVATAVGFSFNLPFGPRIQGHAKVAWSNRDGLTGLEYLFMEDEGKQKLQSWLSSRRGTGRQDVSRR